MSPKRRGKQRRFTTSEPIVGIGLHPIAEKNRQAAPLLHVLRETVRFVGRQLRDIREKHTLEISQLRIGQLAFGNHLRSNRRFDGGIGCERAARYFASSGSPATHSTRISCSTGTTSQHVLSISS